MGPPRRNGARKQSVQYSSDSSAPAQSPVLSRQTAHTPSKPPATNNAMTASTRYLYNLKVLRRRDPSIISVFDQFSHVAVYQFVDGKWEREACEGTMFLYERNAYPPYGYYILNRVGMEDFIGRLYPEDFLQKTGKLTTVQSFPDFTERRLAVVHASAPQYELENRFSGAWAVPNVESLTKADKGSVVTIGLWTLDEVAREPLFEVMQRLHSYIRMNLPYPEEFQYGPDRLPVPSASPAPNIPNGQSLNGFTFPQTNGNGENHSNPSVSELDKLFSKLAPSPSPAIPESSKAKKNSNMTVQSLFASMSGTESTSDNNPSSASSSVSFPSAGSPAPSTGISLLDSIFASAATTTATTSAHTSARGQAQNTAHASTIYTPTPSSGVNPQVLSQDVITQLMGLPPSRAASTVSYSSSAVSHNSSREGYADNEDESDTGTGRLSEFEDGISESSTVLDSGAEDVGAPAPGHGHRMPVNFGSGSTHQGHGIGAHGRVQGDMTPRPPLPGFGGSTEARPVPSRSSTLTSLPPSLKSTATITNGQRCASEPHVQPKPKPQQGPSQQGTPRRLVPFEPDSELWPYSRNNAATHNHNASQQDSSDDIIELDFNDTSALSDPEAFNKAARNGRGAHHQHNGSTSSGAGVGLNGNAKGKVKEKPNKRKSKKERAAEQARVRQEIEDSWDSPAHAGHSSSAGRSHHSHAIADNDKDVFPEVPPPATPSPCPSPVLGPVVSPRAAITPLSLVGARGGTDSRGSPVAQGNAFHPSPMDLRKKIAAINGHAPVNEHAPKEHKEVVKDSLLSAVLTKEAQRPTHTVLEKNDFVREVLTLIHTDKAFVESLYRDYTNRL